MDVVARVSTEEASLILQLIEFAENNDFFEPELALASWIGPLRQFILAHPL